MQNIPAPLVIGATGGSGTRVVARIVRTAGVFIGTNLNAAEDSMEFPEVYDRWINRYMLRDIAPFSIEEDKLLLEDFTAAVERHRLPAGNELVRWGWKEPRSIYFLPFLDALWPQLKFIHIVRDGRDMAFSGNQNQPRRHSHAVLRHELRDAPPPVRSAALWARINSRTASYCETHMAGRYRRVRYEDLCRDPRSTIAEILGLLELDHDPDLTDRALREVVPPDSIGRWRRVGEPAVMESIHLVAAHTLQLFGYR